MKTTAKDFARFKAEFRRWQKRLGLMDWHVQFFHGKLQTDRGAEIRTNLEARLCEVRLAAEWDYRADGLGRHEALELLLTDLDTLCRYRYIRPDEIDSARHAVIQRLSNLFDEMENR